MKYLLLLIVLALVFFLLGVKRARPPTRPPQARPPAPPAPQNMLSCAQCGLHLPRDESLPGRGGVFCSVAHRQAYELEHGEST